MLKVEDNITTDHIMPAGAKILPYRSNIPFLSKFCFEVCDPTFSERAKAAGDGIIVGGMEEGVLTVTTDKGFSFQVSCVLTERQRAILLAGGLLNYTKEGGL